MNDCTKYDDNGWAYQGDPGLHMEADRECIWINNSPVAWEWFLRAFATVRPEYSEIVKSFDHLDFTKGRIKAMDAQIESLRNRLVEEMGK